jgi:hypothetical protein
VLHPEDGITAIDIDNCRDSDTGVIKAWAAGFIKLLNSYAEVSPSGTGVRLFLRGKPRSKTNPSKAFEDGKVELFSQWKYVTITGQHLADTPMTIEVRQQQLDELCRRLRIEPDTPARLDHDKELPIADSFEGSDGLFTTGLSDDEVLEKCREHYGAAFMQLYDVGDWQAVKGAQGRQKYPSQSEADLALCTMLVTFTGHHEAQIDRLFRNSKLLRCKWDEKRAGRTLGAMTIEKARKDKAGNWREDIDYPLGDERCKMPVEHNGETTAPRSNGKAKQHQTTAPDQEMNHKAAPAKHGPAEQSRRPAVRKAAELAHKEYRPPRQLVHEIIVEGVSLLCGRPKKGKSWLCLDMALAVASAEKALGYAPTEQASVLYLALEDSERRFMDRVKKLRDGAPIPGGISFVTDWPRIGDKGLEELQGYLNAYPETKLVSHQPSFDG